MCTKISWLPEIVNEKDYQDGKYVNYAKLIESVYNLFLMDFCNPSAPVMFEGKRVVLNNKVLDCSVLKVENCYNEAYYNCDSCKFKAYFDIFNHISTDDYSTLHKQNPKIPVPKLKVKKKQRKVPRTPGRFNLARLCRIVWIRSIIENSDDTSNVLITKNTYQEGTEFKLIDVDFVLLQEKYKVVIEPIFDKSSKEIKYFVLKTAFYMGDKPI